MGQLHVLPQATFVCDMVQLIEVKLSIIIKLPPFKVLGKPRVAPVTEIGPVVRLVMSKTTLSLDVAKVRRIPVLEKLKDVALTRVKDCPVDTAETLKVAPRNPAI